MYANPRQKNAYPMSSTPVVDRKTVLGDQDLTTTAASGKPNTTTAATVSKGSKKRPTATAPPNNMHTSHPM
jgi:hypothetical protein